VGRWKPQAFRNGLKEKDVKADSGKVDLKLADNSALLGELKIFGERCRNQSVQNLGCTECSDACPVNAVQLNKEPELDRLKCCACGLCVAACESSVFVFPKLFNRLFFKTLSGTDTEETEIQSEPHSKPDGAVLTCGGIPQDSSPSLLSHAPVCLAVLDEVHLIRLVEKYGNLTLDCSHCRDCNFEKGLSFIRKRVAESGAWLGSLGISGQLSIMTEPDSFAEEENKIIPLIREASRSRRDLFRRAGNRGVLEVARQFSDAEDNPQMKTPAPERRNALKSLYLTHGEALLPPEFPENLPLHFVSAKETCQLCTECTVRCPGKALLKMENRVEAKLFFEPLNCLGCTDCEQFCPHDSLEIRALTKNDFPLKERVLFSRGKTKCDSCEKPFLPQNESLTCPACLQYKTLDDDMFNILGW